MLSRVHRTRRLNGRCIMVFLGSQQAMIDETGQSQSMISQWFGTRRSGEPKPIGAAAAKDLEIALKLHIQAISGKYYDGWFDEPHPNIWIRHLGDDPELLEYDVAEECYPESVVIDCFALFEQLRKKNKKLDHLTYSKKSKLFLSILHFRMRNENLSEKDIGRLLDLSSD